MTQQIAVIVVNWNKKKDVLRLLKDLQQIPEPVDIFVVDNASTDGSVAAIRDSFQSVNVVCNQINLGGTGGFNAGLTHVLNEDKYSYVWLLDNDAAIQVDTLTELLNAIDTDTAIGIAGSRIIDIDSRTVTVETGGKIRWDIMTVEPLNRNSTTTYDDIIDADYVAICSALVRVSALKRVGLMDSRFFIFWDDMDWGLYFLKHGYRVICATKSIVYHGSFTERDRGLQIGYYGVRNSFLVYTKHTRLLQRTKIFYRTIHYLLLFRAFLLIHQNHYEAGLIRQALFDFIHNRWGKLSLSPPQEQRASSPPNQPGKLKYPNQKVNLLVSVMNLSREAGNVLLKSSKRLFPESPVTIMVHNDRGEYYKGYQQILVDRKKTSRMSYLLALFLQVKKRGFDVAMAIKPYPLNFAAKNVICVNNHGEIESQTQAGWGYLVRLIAAVLSAGITTLYLFPIILLRSLKYRDESG
jgi:GT2 family glycosyltransferase